jgi:hypothetical protein
MLNYLVRRSLKTRYSEIAKAVCISNEWLEYRCEKPAKPRGCYQVICLSIPGYSFDYLDEEVKIQLSDGRVVQPTIEVIDAAGNTFEAEDSQRAGNLVGFQVRSNTAKGISLSDDRENVTVRV